MCVMVSLCSIKCHRQSFYEVAVCLSDGHDFDEAPVGPLDKSCAANLPGPSDMVQYHQRRRIEHMIST